jgi:hypothetical protein
MVFVSVAFLIRAINQNIEVFGLMLIFGIFLLFCFGAVFLTYGGLDLVVTNDGLSKLFFGKKIQSIKWQDIVLVRRFVVSDGIGKLIKKYNICTNCEKCNRIGFSGKVVFLEDIQDSEILINLINKNVEKYKIKVEICDSVLGQFITSDHL